MADKDPIGGSIPSPEDETKLERTRRKLFKRPNRDSVSENVQPLSTDEHAAETVIESPAGSNGLKKLTTVLPGDDVESGPPAGLPSAYPVEDYTKLPPLTEEEARWLLYLEDELKREVVGQDEAVEILAKTVRRWRTGQHDPTRPIGTMIFLGSIGVGKTHVAQTLDQILYGSESRIIELNLRAFWEIITASAPTVAPGGITGYNIPKWLSDELSSKPLALIIFDKIEEAPPAAQDMLYQIIDHAVIKDQHGHEVSFRKAIVIMTTYIGNEIIRREPRLGFSLNHDATIEEKNAYYEMRKKLFLYLQRTFRKEILFRLDQVVVFRFLNREDTRKIAELQVKKIAHRLWLDHQIAMEATKSAIDTLGDHAYDPEGEAGAFPIRRVIQLYVEDRLSDGILTGQFKHGDEIIMDVDIETEDVILKKKELEPPESLIDAQN